MAVAAAAVPGVSLDIAGGTAATAPALPGVEASVRLGVATPAAPSPARTVYSVLPPLCPGGQHNEEAGRAGGKGSRVKAKGKGSEEGYGQGWGY